MNNLYRKVAVASVDIALGFALGAKKEAKAATITLPPATSFGVIDDRNLDGGDSYYVGVPFYVGHNMDTESRAFYEVNIANLSLASNTVISRAIFQVRGDSLMSYHRSFGLEIRGYKGNGQPDVSDFYAQTYASSILYQGLQLVPRFNFYWNVNMTEFINELISNKDAFAGFKVREMSGFAGDATFNHKDARLIITTVDTEPVPEPTTIFGSALALGLGGWLKRKKSSRQNKTTPQH